MANNDIYRSHSLVRLTMLARLLLYFVLLRFVDAFLVKNAYPVQLINPKRSVPRRHQILTMNENRQQQCSSLASDLEAIIGGASGQGPLIRNDKLSKRNFEKNDTPLLQDSDSDSSDGQLSRREAKSKRFIMMQDVIRAVQDRDKNAVRKAENLIHRMQILYGSTMGEDGIGVPEYAPNVQVYNLLINAHAKTSTKNSNSGRLAEKVLFDMKNVGLQPTAVSYTSVIDAYAQQSRFNPKAAEEAERVMFELISEYEATKQQDLQPTFVTIDSVINAWAQQATREGATRAEQILQQLVAVDGSMKSFNIQPTVRSYAAVVHGYAISGTGSEAARKAQTILKDMIRLHEQRDSTVKPDTVVFNSVIHAWANSGDAQAGTKAEALLHQMKNFSTSQNSFDCTPDIISYNSVLSAWSHSGHMNAAIRSEKVLQDMIIQHKENPKTFPSPNVFTYNNVLNAWSKSKLENAAERSTSILMYMLRSPDASIRPDVYSFSSVLDTIAKSNNRDKVERAETLLNAMLKFYEKTKTQKSKLSLTTVPFNAVINAVAFSATCTPTDEHRDNLKVAVNTFTMIQKYDLCPDSVSYGNLIKCFCNLSPPSSNRDNMILQLFDNCCSDGKVNQLVLKEVTKSVPSKDLASRLSIKGSIRALTVSKLPKEWTCNVSRQMKKVDKNQDLRKESTSKRVRSIEATTAVKGRVYPARRGNSMSEPSYQSGLDV